MNLIIEWEFDVLSVQTTFMILPVRLSLLFGQTDFKYVFRFWIARQADFFFKILDIFSVL